MKQTKQVELAEGVKKTLDKWISKWVVDDGNNKLLWNDKAPTPNQVIDLLAQAQQEAVERERKNALYLAKMFTINKPVGAKQNLVISESQYKQYLSMRF